MESALDDVYTLVVLYQKSHLFASLTCSISDAPQLVCKHRTHALSMKYSIYPFSVNACKSEFSNTDEYGNIYEYPEKSPLLSDYEQSLCFLIVRREWNEKNRQRESWPRESWCQERHQLSRSQLSRGLFFSLCSRRTVRKQRDCL